MGLFQWFKCEPEKRPRPSVTQIPVVPINDVQAASVPDPQLAEQTRSLQTELVQSLMMLGRRSAELKLALGQSTLKNVTGGSTGA